MVQTLGQPILGGTATCLVGGVGGLDMAMGTPSEHPNPH